MFARFDSDVGQMENQQNKKNKNGDSNATHRIIRRQLETDTPPVTDTVIINTSDIERIKVSCFSCMDIIVATCFWSISINNNYPISSFCASLRILNLEYDLLLHKNN
jgi:hypothetical protein